MAFITPEDRAYMSPSSSPGGSPTASSYVDSSPLASPSLQPLDLGRPPTPLGITHPFSGSTHATTHPSNELRYSNSSYAPATWSYRSDIPSTADNPKGFESLFNEEEEGFSISSYDPEPPDEATLWEEKITRAVDMGEAEFTWKDAGLTFIPPYIVELNSLGVISESAQRPFKRVQTAPPAVFSSHRPFFSQRAPPSSARSQGFMIFLANNEIKTLPPEFFKLSNLTVLSLRNNSLDYLPPEIAQLQALKDLDVVNNNLRFLPAEMTTMTLTNLNVHTNPWYPDPAKASGPRDGDGAEIVDNATRVHFCVPPLREVVIRYLLTPAANQQRPLAPSPPASPTTSSLMATARARQPTMLEDRFQLPLQEGTLTPADEALIARLAPAAVSAPRRHAFSRATTSGPAGAGLFAPTTPALQQSKSERECPTHCSLTGLGAATTQQQQQQHEQQQNEQKSCSGRCPSPRHNCATPSVAVVGVVVVGQPWPWPRLGPPFVMPAEERYTWVTELAGVRVGESTGGVPILWRGCGRGCLDFLDQGNASIAAPVGEPMEGGK